MSKDTMQLMKEGVKLFKKNNFSGASNKFTEALSTLDPRVNTKEYGTCHYFLAVSAFKQKNYAAASEHLGQCIAIQEQAFPDNHKQMWGKIEALKRKIHEKIKQTTSMFSQSDTPQTEEDVKLDKLLDEAVFEVIADELIQEQQAKERADDLLNEAIFDVMADELLYQNGEGPRA